MPSAPTLRCRYRLMFVMMCFSLVIFMTACGEGSKQGLDLEKINFAEDKVSSEYTEFLYFKGRLYGIGGVVGEEVFEGRIGKKIGEITGIGETVKESGDIGVTNAGGTFLFETGNGIYKITDTSEKLLVLIKTSEGYLHTKLQYQNN